MSANVKSMRKIAAMATAAMMAAVLAIGMAPGIDPGLEAQAASKPAKVASVKATSVKDTSAKITWKKASSKKVRGYYVSVSTSKSFAKSKTKTYKVTKRITVAKTVKSLKQNTRYYVKVRAYTTSHGKKVYGKWSSVRSFTTAKTVCTVSYSLPDGSKRSVKAHYGTKISSLKAPAVADHDFAGWYTNKSMTAKASSSATVTKSMTLYPKYVRQTVTVSYEVDGETVTKEVAKGDAIPLEAPDVAAGYAFCGWYSDEALTKEVTDLTASGSVKLYAKVAEDCAGDGSLKAHSWTQGTRTVTITDKEAWTEKKYADRYRCKHDAAGNPCGWTGKMILGPASADGLDKIADKYKGIDDDPSTWYATDMDGNRIEIFNFNAAYFDLLAQSGRTDDDAVDELAQHTETHRPVGCFTTVDEDIPILIHHLAETHDEVQAYTYCPDCGLEK